MKPAPSLPIPPVAAVITWITAGGNGMTKANFFFNSHGGGTILAPPPNQWIEITSARGHQTIQRGHPWEFSLKYKVTDSDGMEAGFHRVTWNGFNENGTRVSSGIYIYELRAGE